MLYNPLEPYLIAGPCAFESKKQFLSCLDLLLSIGVKKVRAPLWKPRTFTGWDGVGEEGLKVLLAETWERGMVPATEVLTKEHVHSIVSALKEQKKQEIIVWIGARNQNHIVQREIAKALLPIADRTTLFFKNQMWDDEEHWVGIFAHIIATGFPKERMMSCHRGFAPGKENNPSQFRNIPDFEMAMRVKSRLQIPMLLDPSHIGGSAAKVKDALKQSFAFAFDGYLIEVHPYPEGAFTDAKQQLKVEELEEILSISCL